MIKIYLKCSDAQGVHLSSKKNGAATPVIVRGMAATLEVSFFDEEREPLSGLASYASWGLIVKAGYGAAAPVLVASQKITINELGTITIELTDTNTDALAAKLGTQSSCQVTAQLSAYLPQSQKPGFVVQFPLIINNTLDDGAEPPTDTVQLYLTSVQTHALLAGCKTVDFKVDSVPLFLDATGYYNILDSANPVIKLIYDLDDAAAVMLKIKSADPGAGGDVVLAVTVNGEQVAVKTVNVTAGLAAVVFDFSPPISGFVTITRLTLEPEDTLGDVGGKISAIVKNIKIMEDGL